MSSSPHISFMLHNVARLLRTRFGQRLPASGLSRAQSRVPAYLRLREGIRRTIMRGNGRKTRDEAFAGLSSATPQHRLQTPRLIKSNLLAARTQPAGDREKVHG
ncbi:hypothetical protein FJ546_14390 [Mesorhizobium sp. B2-4-19]|uniref:hypothetical protein n=1 Tax=Mesorhizobium sp. B2-4-19 TaxID=2589930 RepID=UPI00112C7993|nr:hypothetical protein [Mesorhizobium sp. B2-4-19]TPK62900.1 hypothetical protein FJ546_14390 [Mesorhizobium sp. B2-4-19]